MLMTTTDGQCNTFIIAPSNMKGNTYRRQTLTSKFGPRTERVKHATDCIFVTISTAIFDLSKCCGICSCLISITDLVCGINNFIYIKFLVESIEKRNQHSGHGFFYRFSAGLLSSGKHCHYRPNLEERVRRPV